tara:strand:- start:274 stop:1200 length:927 start_codon:yes stop_codon:yes gene_type:complete
MGIKRRIMTSGQKFVDKHRALLKKMMDASKFGGATGTAEAIDIPGQKPFIDNLSITQTAGTQTFTFVAALGGVPAAGDADTLTVTLNGTVLTTKPAIPSAISDDDITVGGVAYTKAYYGRPASAAPTGTEWLAGDRRCLDAANTPAIANVGENTLKVAVTSNNKTRVSQTVKFTATAATAAITEHASLVTPDDGNNQLDTNLNAGGGRVSGIVAGDKNAWALDTNKYEITVTDADGNDVLLKAAGGSGRTVSVDEKTATVAKSGDGGTLNQADLLKTAAAGTYTVTFHLLNMKNQRQYSFTAAPQAVA